MEGNTSDPERGDRMQLASLELFGFKSFAKRTRFDFGSGVTIIVGPNGCGKSNVVDSLKWVLGEQSAKSLRGSEMMDVIFNGSKNRKPLGFSEASLSFRGCRGEIHPDLDTITVTRKLYRSGESEYQINKKPCRLKDIRELFMDTGVGMKAYSIIEQGKIDAMLQSTGAERRLIFDEAAGISKYKARKKETLRRLERTEQNLVIIDTTLEEVGKRLRSLKIQAGRARKFIAYRDELRKYRIAQALHKYHGFRQEQVRVSGEVVMAENEKEKLGADRAKAEADLSVLEENLHDHEEKHRAASGEAERLAHQVDADGRRKEDLEKHLKDLGQEEVRLQGGIAECLRRIEKAREDLSGSEARHRAAREEEQTLARHLQETETSLESIRRALAEIDREVESLKAEALDNEAAKAKEKSRIGRIEEDLVRLGKERAGAEASLRELGAQRDHARGEIERLKGEIRELEATIAGSRKALQEVQEELHRHKERAALLEKEAGALAERKVSVSSRIDVLQKYKDRLEGVGEGASRVLREAREHPESLLGLVGLLGDRIRVQPRYVKALEAALSDLSGAVVVEDFETALEALEFLRESDKGRGRFLLRPGEAPERIPPERYRYPGVVGRAADLVDAPDADRDLVERILGRLLVVDSLDVAVGLQDLLGGTFSFATLAGEVVDPGLMLSGGAALKGRISHAAELEELQGEAGRIDVKADEVRRQREALGKSMGAVEEKEGALRHQIYDVHHEIVARQKHAQGIEEQGGDLDRQIEALAAECDRIRSDQEVREREAADAREALQDLRGRGEDIGGKIEEREAEREKGEGRRAESERRYNDLRIEHRGVTERVGFLQEEVDRIRSEIQGREEEYRDTVVRIEENAARREALTEEIADLEKSVVETTRQLGAVREEAGRLQTACDGLQQDVSLKKGEVRTLRESEEEVASRLGDLSLKEREFHIRVEEIVSRTAEELSVVLPDLYEEFDDEACDWAEIETKVVEFKEKIDRLGNVNLDAIEECDEEEARFKYLEEQKTDLVRAKEQLSAVIRKIDRKSKEMFLKTFSDIRESFKVLFRKLFGGGKADIFLQDENDVLESPVEVMAQPKDKKPSSISLLSGGEKVMTCIALLFSIFKAKPSPFCILDEVDAALDEGNIDRFVGMLDEFVKGSQFIIISHNKKTMMVGDAIFGVTMQEAGVSKKVSLKIEEANRVIDEAEAEAKQKPGAEDGASETAPDTPASGSDEAPFSMGSPTGPDEEETQGEDTGTPVENEDRIEPEASSGTGETPEPVGTPASRDASA